MTDSINTLSPISTGRPVIVKQGDVHQVASEAPTQTKEVRARLLQVGQLAQAARSAAAMQVARCNQLAVEGLGWVDPPRTEILQNPELFEEFRRKQQREGHLVGGSQQALSKSDRTQTDLLRSLDFLLPQLRPDDQDDGISLPGFDTPMQDPSAMDTSGLVWDSHSDFYEQISALLGVLKTEWLSKYQDALGKFLEFYKELSDIMEKIRPGAWGEDGGVIIDFNEADKDLKKLQEKYGLDANALASFSTEGAAEAFKKSIGLPGLTVSGPSADGKFHVKMDLSAIADLRESMWSPMIPKPPNEDGKPWPDGERMNSAMYNAWVSRKDSNMEEIKHTSKVLGEKLSEMTQKYDNIVKILSSTIDKITEADMGFVRGL